MGQVLGLSSRDIVWSIYGRNLNTNAYTLPIWTMKSSDEKNVIPRVKHIFYKFALDKKSENKSIYLYAGRVRLIKLERNPMAYNFEHMIYTFYDENTKNTFHKSLEEPLERNCPKTLPYQHTWEEISNTQNPLELMLIQKKG